MNMVRIAFLVALPALVLPGSLTSQEEIPAWRLTVDRQIGALDGDAALTWIHDVAVGGDTVYVLQQMDKQIALFSRAGSRIGTIGRPGQGPGEFIQPTKLGWISGNLWVADPRAEAIAIFGEGGQLLETKRVRPAMAIDALFRLEGLLRDGGAVGTVVRPNDQVAGAPSTVPLVKVNLPEDTAWTLEMLRFENSIMLVETDRSRVSMPQPISTGSLFDIAPDGSRVVVIHQEDYARRGGFTVNWIGADGKLHSKQYVRSPKKMDPAARDSIVLSFANALVQRGSFSSANKARRAVEEAMHLPELLPPVSGLFVASDNNVWLRHEEYSSPTVVYSVLNEEGSVLGALEVPRSVTLLDAEGGKAWGRVVDLRGVTYLVVHTIHR